MFKLVLWLQALFLAFKFFHVIAWSWWWVLSPLIIPMIPFTIIGWILCLAVLKWARIFKPDSKTPFSDFLNEIDKRK